MPYTPPSHPSPASSTPPSPDASRRTSLYEAATGATARPRPHRSASYLTRQRRTPSAETTPSHVLEVPHAAAVNDMRAATASMRQSLVDGSMPRGAIMSPPDSSSEDDDDDDEPEVGADRGRTIENLQELHDAISQIPQRRGSSPDTRDESGLVPNVGGLLAVPEVLHHSFSTGALDGLVAGARRPHAQSLTGAVMASSRSAGPSAHGSVMGSGDDSDDEPRHKPPMVRKKSGELVRPALRLASQRRPSSMPGTPTYAKAVHFDSHLEHVRHFLQVDRPLAVSAGSSPVDNHDSDCEYPWDHRSATRTPPPHEWEIIMSNFPAETCGRKALPVRLERVWLSQDHRSLVGTVVVANLAFHKYVTCRFTLDYWKTTSEVVAEYLAVVRPSEHAEGSDRFQFTIKLSDLANLETKTLFFCIRYSVSGNDLWDNNGGTNFQVDFRKMQPRDGRRSGAGHGLPRSSRRISASDALGPKPGGTRGNEFGPDVKPNHGRSLHEYLGEAPTTLRLKSRSAVNLPTDSLASRLSAPSGQAFANRYDFGASLSAAVQAAKDSMGGKHDDALYMKPARKTPGSLPNTSQTINSQAPAAAVKVAPPATNSLGAGLASSSYEELVNKYCFFGTKQPSPQARDDGLRSGRFDGMDDANEAASGRRGSRSSDESPLRGYGAPRPAANRLPDGDANSYFQPPRTMDYGPGSPLKPTPATAPNDLDDLSPTSGYASFGGMSPDMHACPQSQDRYPFFGNDTHPTTAIRG